MKYPITEKRAWDTSHIENVCPGNLSLVMTYGYPRSGKSTWARQQGVPIVDPDAIRLAKTGQRWWRPIEHEVWSTARTMVRALFWAGHKTVILDTTCYTRLQRDMFAPTPDIPWKRYFKPFDTTVTECCRRARETYPQLVDVIKWIDANWEHITPAEEILLWTLDKPVKL
jgi:predicted kinase